MITRAARKRGKAGRTGYYFVLPFLLLLVLFKIYPLLYTFLISLMKWDLLSPKQFLGLKNYQRLVADEVFYISIWNTFLIWLMNIVGRLGIALFFAHFLTQRRFARTKHFFMAIFYLPNLITAASIAALFAIFLDWQTGPLNILLIKMGIIAEPVYWLNSPAWTRFYVALTIGWMWFGYAMILLIAGMSAIPEELFESATIDGASDLQRFRRITLPLIRPTLIYVLITSLIGGLQNFDVPRIITDGWGSPRKSILTTVMYLYNQSFMNFNLGYGAAVSYGLFLVIIVVTVSSFRALYGSEGSKP